MDSIEIKVTLLDIEPAVTRVLQVPADIRLDHLHLTIQAAMGWTNSHLHMFEAGGTEWCAPGMAFNDAQLPEDQTTLQEVINSTGQKIINYTYDFGDSWEQKINIGKSVDPVPGEPYPRLIEVTGKCPPEDIGSFPGYYEFLKALADPKHPEHNHFKNWYGGAFDPNHPEIVELKREVLSLAKSWN